MPNDSRNALHVAAEFQPIFRELGIDAEAIFTHPLIKPWRVLPERENCTLDVTLAEGRKIRWHIKRFKLSPGSNTAMADEVRGHELLLARQIPTANLIGWGKIETGQSFIIFEDLSGYAPADKLVEAGTPFERILHPTADMAAMLHGEGLHHRDLYLCHFFVKIDAERVDVRLIDAARVRPLPKFLTRTRWTVKDLSQFWYSTTKLAVTDEQRVEWLDRYVQQRNLGPVDSLRRKIERKVNWITLHDVKLRQNQPGRNISIPSPLPPGEG